MRIQHAKASRRSQTCGKSASAPRACLHLTTLISHNCMDAKLLASPTGRYFRPPVSHRVLRTKLMAQIARRAQVMRIFFLVRLFRSRKRCWRPGGVATRIYVRLVCRQVRRLHALATLLLTLMWTNPRHLPGGLVSILVCLLCTDYLFACLNPKAARMAHLTGDAVGVVFAWMLNCTTDRDRHTAATRD